MSFSSLRNNVLGSFANLLTLIVMKYGNIWFNALDLTINALFILRVEVIVHFLHYQCYKGVACFSRKFAVLTTVWFF